MNYSQDFIHLKSLLYFPENESLIFHWEMLSIRSLYWTPDGFSPIGYNFDSTYLQFLDIPKLHSWFHLYLLKY